MKTLDLIDALRAKYGSDYKSAQALGVTRQALSRYRGRHDTLGDAMAVKVADLLDLDRAAVLAAMAAERSTSPEAKRALLAAVDTLAKRVRKTAAAFALVSIASSTTYAPEASAAVPVARDGLYIMVNARTRRTRRRRLDFRGAAARAHRDSHTRNRTRSLPLSA